MAVVKVLFEDDDASTCPFPPSITPLPRQVVLQWAAVKTTRDAIKAPPQNPIGALTKYGKSPGGAWAPPAIKCRWGVVVVVVIVVVVFWGEGWSLCHPVESGPRSAKCFNGRLVAVTVVVCRGGTTLPLCLLLGNATKRHDVTTAHQRPPTTRARDRGWHLLPNGATRVPVVVGGGVSCEWFSSRLLRSGFIEVIFWGGGFVLLTPPKTIERRRVVMIKCYLILPTINLKMK